MNSSLKNILLPTKWQAVVSVMVAAILMIIASGPLIVQKVSSYGSITPSLLTAGTQKQLEYVNRIEVLNDLGIIVFWICMGWVLYLIWLIIVNGIAANHNAVLVEKEFVNHSHHNLMRLMAMKAGIVAIGFGIAFVSVKWGIFGLMNELGEFNWYLDLWFIPISILLGLSILVYTTWTSIQISLQADELDG